MIPPMFSVLWEGSVGALLIVGTMIFFGYILTKKYEGGINDKRPKKDVIHTA